MTEEMKREIMYRKVFGTDEGKQVLADILNDCGFFSLEDMQSEDLVRVNVAKRILGKMGAWQEQNLFDITECYIGGHKNFLRRLLSIGRRDR